MKQKVKISIIAFLSAVLLVTAALAGVSLYGASAASNGAITCQNASSYSQDYFTVYKVPTDMFTYEANGGGAIANAFDGNWNTAWKSDLDNGKVVDGVKLVNAVTVTFNSAVDIGSIAYAASSERNAYGYPQTLRIYVANGGEPELYGTCNSTPTNDRVLFKFAETLTVTKLKFEFTQPNRDHRWDAAAKEIQFLQPENDSANDVLQLFTDYTQHTVQEQYKSRLAQMREDVKGLISYESALKPLLDRAEAVVSGELVKNDRYEYSTDPAAQNVIQRWGNLIGYAKTTLKVNAYGYTTNRQATGIGGLSGDKITVYVDAPNPKDPLPVIVFSQASGYWQNWRSEQTLVRGKNVLTIPNFLVEPNGTGGGPIYIANGYDKNQQSSDVKIYIEGGHLIPTFRYGDDEEAFKTHLKEYEERRLSNPSSLVDVCEIVGDHFINTSKSSYAYNHYIKGTVSPQKNTENWEKYMTGLLAFDGITMNPEDEHFDERNLHMPVNFRIAHWSGYGAYAVGEHIGLVALGHGSLTNLVAPGWGLSHEIGHMLDLGERTRAETTNNMLAVYGDLLMNNSMNTGKAQHIVAPAQLYPDETATDYNYFHKNGYSISQWWNLEVAYPGFWGRLDNLYRYYDRAAAFTNAGVTAKAEQNQFSMTEKMVYFSSLATGVDLGYYYERYGFAYESTPFKVANASAAYTKLVAKAIEDGVLSTKQYKYWYFDINQYFHDVNERACYDASGSVTIREIWQSGNQHTLILPKPADSNRHLGYEVKEYRDGNWYVIGFTRTESFTDTTEYAEGYTPRYKVCAYDRQLNCSADSAEMSISATSQTNVCRIGETYYNSLAEAVAAANAGDTIYLCADTQEESITIDKNLTILPGPSVEGSVVVKRHSTSSLLTVNAGTLNIGGGSARIIFDGLSFTQGSSLINIGNGAVILNNVVVRNNYCTTEGGAFKITQAGKTVRLVATNCEFTNNSASHGGAIYNLGRAQLVNCVISGNRASNNGGAIANYKGGVMTFTNCTVSGNSAAVSGGAFSLDGSTVLSNTTVTGNTAGANGGGLFVAITSLNRTVSINGGSLEDNEAKQGNAFYLDNGYLYLDVYQNSELSISGEIYKKQGDIRLSTSQIDFSKVVFYLPSIADDVVLLSVNGSVTLNEELLESVRVYLGRAYLNEGKTNVMAANATVEITLNVNGQSVAVEKHTGGWEFTLPQTIEETQIPEGKEFDGWEVDGKKYGAGESVVISDSTQINAILKDKPADKPSDDSPNNPSDDPSGNPSKPSDEKPGESGGTGEKELDKVGLIVGVSVGVVVVVAGSVAVWWFFIKKKKSK